MNKLSRNDKYIIHFLKEEELNKFLDQYKNTINLELFASNIRNKTYSYYFSGLDKKRYKQLAIRIEDGKYQGYCEVFWYLANKNMSSYTHIKASELLNHKTKKKGDKNMENNKPERVKIIDGIFKGRIGEIILKEENNPNTLVKIMGISPFDFYYQKTKIDPINHGIFLIDNPKADSLLNSSPNFFIESNYLVKTEEDNNKDDNIEKDKFKIGDEVIYTSGKFSSGNTNPLWTETFIKGKISYVSKLKKDLKYRVDWENGCNNTYSETDLEFYDEKKHIKK